MKLNIRKDQPKKGRLAAQLALAAIALLILTGTWKVATEAFHLWEAIQATQTVPVIEARASNPKRAIHLSEELTQRITENSQPDTSRIGLLGTAHERHELETGRLLHALATEIGATKTVGAINTLRENRSKQASLRVFAKIHGGNPGGQNLEAVTKLEKENGRLISFVRENLEREGFEMSLEETQALCAAPNAEDIASLISAFGSLKTITAEMERRLRTSPSPNLAQHYYASHWILLSALDLIQKRAIQNIDERHIPRTLQIQEETHKAEQEAKHLLATGNLSKNEKLALQWNIQTCQYTRGVANQTQMRLNENRAALDKANRKLENSLAASKNSHMTASLQAEVLGLEHTHLMEVAKIEALSVPEIVATCLTDPENPLIWPPPPPAPKP
jgi:hypothetical protein